MSPSIPRIPPPSVKVEVDAALPDTCWDDSSDASAAALSSPAILCCCNDTCSVKTFLI